MYTRHLLRGFLVTVLALWLAGCASLETRDPLEVTVAGVEVLPGEGMELRMLVRLRVQNPNDEDLRYDGAYVKLEVLGKTFATGVSDESGTVPRFGEAVIGVPVTVSVLRMVRQVVGMLDGQPVDKITYVMQGKLSGPGMSAQRFRSQGEFTLPKGPAGTTDPARL